MITVSDMSEVAECTIAQCAYNVSKACHARAITIGDGVHPGCDTFFKSAIHASNGHTQAGVGACKVANCVHNDDFECQADSIRVGNRGTTVECLTYTSI